MFHSSANVAGMIKGKYLGLWLSDTNCTVCENLSIWLLVLFIPRSLMCSLSCWKVELMLLG